MNRDLHQRAHQALAHFVNRTREAPPWQGRKIVIYGAGGFGRDLAKALLPQPRLTLLGFLDQNGCGQKILHGLESHTLESPTASRWQAEKPVVIIGAYNQSASLREITTRLTQFGFSTIITPMEAYLHLNRELGWRYWLGTPEDYDPALGQIEQARALWADSESERLFLETLLFRLNFDLDMAASPSGASVQYADPSLPRWAEPLCVVDGGAYTGDTLESLSRRGYRFASVHAFEPDAENFQKLCARASAFPPETRISLWPCGLWSSTCRMNFDEVGGASSKISDAGKALVPLAALDDVLHHQRVNLIKLDIEGAEAEALRGARRLIEKYRPGLAVCLYHHPHHLWSIPLWVQGLNLDYQFYFRAHEYNTFDTVLYALPKPH